MFCISVSRLNIALHSAFMTWIGHKQQPHEINMAEMCNVCVTLIVCIYVRMMHSCELWSNHFVHDKMTSCLTSFTFVYTGSEICDGENCCVFIMIVWEVDAVQLTKIIHIYPLFFVFQNSVCVCVCVCVSYKQWNMQRKILGPKHSSGAFCTN